MVANYEIIPSYSGGVIVSESEWSTLIKECQASGMSIKLWCKNHGITYRQYSYWVKKLHKPQRWA
ncbi:MAG: IS66 family insertion sequence element accessory protein TnpA [Ruminiclostridium sp.]